MAIVFISPKKRARMITMAVILLVLAAMGIIFLATFFQEMRNHFQVVLPQAVATVPNVKINVALLDSDRVAQLKPFVAQTNPEITIGKEDPFVPYYPLIIPKK